MEAVTKGMGQNLPAHLRPVNNFSGYKYPHDFPLSYVEQQYLPDDLKDTVFYKYGNNKTEQSAKQYWQNIKEQCKKQR